MHSLTPCCCFQLSLTVLRGDMDGTQSHIKETPVFYPVAHDDGPNAIEQSRGICTRPRDRMVCSHSLCLIITWFISHIVICVHSDCPWKRIPAQIKATFRDNLMSADNNCCTLQPCWGWRDTCATFIKLFMLGGSKMLSCVRHSESLELWSFPGEHASVLRTHLDKTHIT